MKSDCVVFLGSLIWAAACAAAEQSGDVGPIPANRVPAAVAVSPGGVTPPGVGRGLLRSINAGKKLGDEMECLVEPRQVSSVGSAVEGTLAEVLVDRGTYVSKGQVLARLNSPVESASVALRQAQAEFGERKVERNKELFRKELISANEKDEMETQTRLAKLELEQQRANLAQRTIRSPFSGVVVERYMSPGEHVGTEKILKLAEIDPLHVEVVVPVELFGAIRAGMAGEVRFTPLMRDTFVAHVTAIDKVVDAASGTFGVRLELPNRGGRIPSGIKCTVRIGVGK